MTVRECQYSGSRAFSQTLPKNANAEKTSKNTIFRQISSGDITEFKGKQQAMLQIQYSNNTVLNNKTVSIPITMFSKKRPVFRQHNSQKKKNKNGIPTALFSKNTKYSDSNSQKTKQKPVFLQHSSQQQQNSQYSENSSPENITEVVNRL